MGGRSNLKAGWLRRRFGPAVVAGALGAALLPGSATAAVLWEQDEPLINFAPSAKHEPANAEFDSQLADDFVVTGADGVTVTKVFAPGAYFELCGGTAGPAGSVNVFFYADTLKGGTRVPAETALASRPNLPPSSGLPTGVFDIPIVPPVSLEPGVHWLSVQPSLNCATNGSWNWDVLTFSERSQAAWRNPLAGILAGCETFLPLTQCETTTPVDARFRIEGTVDPVVVALAASIAKNKAKKLLVEAGCGDEACTVTVGGKGSAKPAKGSAATTSAKKKKLKFKVKEQTASVAANATTTLQLKFNKHAKKVKQIKRLIKKKDGKAKIALNVTATDSAGATDAATLKKKLKP